ncbi:hypothetical protein [Celeribacter indicus]|uniref:Uncharacterized protein n=1 Tax=Celeribacter indicus TaxID=1208324 RepID=A0A0B5E7D3_9RHOB|nr:hypothetical protein [Celeribacter indicus]AJE48187.1 hypothetical protein P73_3472 [Celeribacter indicus]SDW68921.1 hypothetical protein SAMN05443573_10614 [Celeribacter indicus]
MLKTTLRAALAAALSTPLAAADLAPDYALIPLASHHYGDWGEDDGDDFTEFNPGLLFTWAERAGGLNYTFGAYRDSMADVSLHLSAAKMWQIGPYAEAGIVGAYLHSFGEGYTGFAPSLQVNYKHLFINAATGYDDGVYGVVSTGLIFDIGR